jgi:hypothetical protein
MSPKKQIEECEIQGPYWPLTWTSAPSPVVWECLGYSLVRNNHKVRGGESSCWNQSFLRCAKVISSEIGKRKVCTIFLCVTIMSVSCLSEFLQKPWYSWLVNWPVIWISIKLISSSTLRNLSLSTTQQHLHFVCSNYWLIYFHISAAKKMQASVMQDFWAICILWYWQSKQQYPKYLWLFHL